MIKSTPLYPAEKAWMEQKNKLKKQFPFLTEDDLRFELNKKNLLMNHLQITLGKTKTELENLLSTL